MIVEGDPILTRIVDKQFEILGLKIKFCDIPDHGVLEVGKVKDYWYNIYKFTEEQEKKWLEWARKELEGVEDMENWLTYLELRYGLPRSYKKKGELF